MKQHSSSRTQRGGFIIGLVIGLLIGLALALGVALYVTKAPNPFVNKVPARPAGQDAAEIERNRNWDPNSALAGRNPAPVASAPTVAPAPAAPDPSRPAIAAPTLPGPGAAPSASAPRVARPSAAASGAVAAASAPRGSQPVSTTTGTSPFSYFVQAGAYARTEDAEQQRARLAMLGVESRLTEREQAGRTVYRVRVGPFERREDAESTREKLGSSGVDATLVAVQR